MGPNDGGGAADRDGVAEEVADRAVVGQELGDLVARDGVEEVGGAGVDAVVVVVKACADDGGGVADRDGAAEVVLSRAVARKELGDLTARGGVKQVGGAGELAVVVVEGCPDNGGFLAGGAADRDEDAERVARRAIVGQELDDLPARGGVEEVGGTGARAVVVVQVGPDDGGGATDCHGLPEEVVRSAVVGQELGDLTARGGVKEVCGAGVESVVVVETRPNDGGGTADRHGEAEQVARRAIVGQELGDLGARGGVEEVGRARTAA